MLNWNLKIEQKICSILIHKTKQSFYFDRKNKFYLYEPLNVKYKCVDICEIKLLILYMILMNYSENNINNWQITKNVLTRIYKQNDKSIHYLYYIYILWTYILLLWLLIINNLYIASCILLN